MKKARGIDMDTKKLRQKILDLAIRGKLVPQDPNDEPASVLLERIRAEKERLIKEGKIKRSKKSASDMPHSHNGAYRKWLLYLFLFTPFPPAIFILVTDIFCGRHLPPHRARYAFY